MARWGQCILTALACPRRYWQSYRGLQSHLITLVLMALLPLVLFSVFMVLMFAQEERRTTERGMRKTVRALALAVDRVVGEVQAVVISMLCCAHNSVLLLARNCNHDMGGQREL
jgi:uncharacterized membrane protein